MNRDDIAKIFGPELQQAIDAFTHESANFNKNLYHYTKFDTLEKILHSKRIHLNYYRNLNDPQEVINASNRVPQKISDLSNSSMHTKYWKYFNRLFSQTINELEFYICSFCESHSNVELWDKYGDHNNGVCIGFYDRLYSSQKSSKKLITLEKVQYNLDDFDSYLERLYNIIDRKIGDVNNTNYNHVVSELAIYIIPLIPKFKEMISVYKEAWFHEKEWRLYQITFSKMINKKIARSERYKRPKNNVRSFVDVKPGDICEVWLGNNSQQHINDIKKMLDNYGHKMAKVYQSE